MVCKVYATMDVKYDLEKICRVCMCEANDMKAIFGSTENISKILMTCSSINVAENDELPKQICLQCIRQANNANLFKQQCERSDNVLRDYIKLKQNCINNIKQEQLSNFNEFHDIFQPEITIGENIGLEDENTNNLLGTKNEVKTETLSGPLCLCGVCGEIFDGSSALTQHVLQKHANNSTMHKCPTCNLMFDDTNLLQHVNNCGKREYSCNRCCESYEQSNLLEKHKETHSDDRSNYCVICNCAFTKLSILRKHKSTHHQNQTETNSNDNNSDEDKSIMSILQEDVKEFLLTDTISSPEPIKQRRGRPKLNRCPERFPDETKLKRESTFQCTFCSEVFARKLHLKKHIESVHEEKTTEESYECTECKKDFSKPELLKRHMKHHTEKKYTCDDCPKKFSKLEQLTEHRKRHTGERSYLCSKCGKGYFKQSHLDKHMSTHLNDHLEKPVYECSICGKKLNHSNHLQVHMRTHRDRHGQPLIPQVPNPNKKVILCSVCGKSCSSRSNLAVHMRRHTGQMTNFCKICGKGYPRTTDLTLHMRQHTGEKPFVCSVCSRGFARSDKLAIHMRTHTGEKPYACGVCGRAFAQSNDLASHKRRNMCGQNNAGAHQNHAAGNGVQMTAGAPQMGQVVAANVVQRLDRVADIAAHTRAVELAAQAAAHHSRIEYTDYTTAALLQNLSSGHFMR